MTELPAIATVVMTIIIFSALLGILILALDILYVLAHPDDQPFLVRLKQRRHIESIYD